MADTSGRNRNYDMQRLCDNPGHYFKCLRAYTKASARFNIMADWCDNVFPEQVVDKLQVNLPDGDDFRALGVGTGSGEMDSMMMCKLLERYPRITNCAVEPADDEVKKYQDLVKKKADEFTGVTFDWRKQRFEEFRKTRLEDGETVKFHFISVIHSFYYIDDWEDSLRWLYEQLEEGGVLLVIQQSDDSGFYRLVKRFEFILNFSEFMGDRLPHHPTSGHIRDAFSKANIPFTNYKLNTRVDITNSFEQGNKDGQLKVDFLLAVVNFHDTASPELRREVLEYLGGPDCSERKDGKILCISDRDAVIATK